MATRVQNLKSLALTVADILHEVRNFKTGQLSGKIFHRQVGFSMISQCTKFEVSRFTRYEAMNGAKCRKLGGLGAVRGQSRPTSQRRAVGGGCGELRPAALFSADSHCRRRRRLSPIFRTTTYFFHQRFRSLVDDDDDRALHDLSADSTMTSPLLCDTTYLSVS